MLEPNPDCFDILRVNARISLKICQMHCYNLGLGDEASTSILTVPKHNWGGAFIHDKFNSYSDELLANKDCFGNLDSQNYERKTIKIVPAVDVFKNIFEKMASEGLTKGIMKIDVEGYESTILDALAETIPNNFNLIVLFESWNKDFDAGKMTRAFFNQSNCMPNCPPTSSAQRLHNSQDHDPDMQSGLPPQARRV